MHYSTLSRNAETIDFARLTSHPVRGWTGKNKTFCSPGTQNGCRVIKVYYVHYTVTGHFASREFRHLKRASDTTHTINQFYLHFFHTIITQLLPCISRSKNIGRVVAKLPGGEMTGNPLYYTVVKHQGKSSLHTSLGEGGGGDQAGAYCGLGSMTWLGGFLLPPGWHASPPQG